MAGKTRRKIRTSKRELELPANCFYDEAKVNHVIDWTEEYCTHTTGDLQGERLILPDWYKTDFIAPVFGIINERTGYRQFWEIYEEVASGNAKSTLGQSTALYCFAADGQMSPRVYSIAGSKEQAGIIFEGAKMMVQNNRDLSSEIEILRNSLSIKSEKYGLGIFKSLSADSDVQEGLNGTAYFFDELHVQKNGNLFYNIKKNAAKRNQVLLWSKTTAGVVFTFAHEYHSRAKKILEGTLKAPGFYAGIYEADQNGDDFDEDQWKLANPGWDYLNKEMIRQAAEDAKKSGAALSAFKRYRLNKWVNASNTWLSPDQWMKGTACKDHSEKALAEFRRIHLSQSALAGRECILGVDLSSNRDTSSINIIFPPKEKGERVKIIPIIYIPKASLYERAEKETPKYLDWEATGDIIVTEGEKQDQDQIFDHISEFTKGFKVIGVAYDSWNAGQLINRFEKAGIETKAYKQDFPFMNMPMRDIENSLPQGMIEHGGHSVLAWHCSNTEAKTRMIGGSEYIMPTKSTELGRIDAMVALIIGYGFMIWKMKDAEVVSQSIVKNQGITRIQLKRR